MPKPSKKHPIALLVGTRPELIKMAPVIRELRNQAVPYILIHSNQHYSKEMDASIVADLHIPEPNFNLRVGSATHAVQTGKVMIGVEHICNDHRPSVLVVHGDTNTTLGGALTAQKLHIAVAHVEAGLRSFDNTMPEETNRILTDHLSEILFAPTEVARKNLLADGLSDRKIWVTGNTIVDALREHIPLSEHSTISQQFNLPKKFLLLTAHRAENVDNKDSLKKLLTMIEFLHSKMGTPIIWPMHPRTRLKLHSYRLPNPTGVVELPPVGYLDMLWLLQKAELIATDSGGIQEEAYILRKPLITLRDTTERPETLSANFLVHMDTHSCDLALQAYAKNTVSWGSEFGTGVAAQHIVAALRTVS